MVNGRIRLPENLGGSTSVLPRDSTTDVRPVQDNVFQANGQHFHRMDMMCVFHGVKGYDGKGPEIGCFGPLQTNSLSSL